MVQFYFLNFATDVLLLAPLGVGILFAAGRVWDAISDPIVGTFSDRTNTRLGRRKVRTRDLDLGFRFVAGGGRRGSSNL